MLKPYIRRNITYNTLILITIAIMFQTHIITITNR